MGGDDLGSDDEYLAAPLRADLSKYGEDDDDFISPMSTKANDRQQRSIDDDDHPNSKKRLHAQTLNPDSNDLATARAIRESSLLASVQPTSKKRRKKERGGGTSSSQSNLCWAKVDVQARLLSDLVGVPFGPQHMAKTLGRASSAKANEDDNSNDENDDCLRKRVQQIVSKKKLKKWKPTPTRDTTSSASSSDANNTSVLCSPCVIVVCMSARRAVQILKELAPLNVRVAKLFAKHISMKEQLEQLRQSSKAATPFALAVGTPHRLVTLLEHGALSLSHVQCVALDTYVNDKQCTVYTLQDTVPHVQTLLRTMVYPECQKRNDIRVAFV